MFRIPIQLNPDPAKKLNPDKDPSYCLILTVSENNIPENLFRNFKISHLNK